MIHKQLRWLRCTTDGVLMEADKMIALLEIKTYTSKKNLDRDIKFMDEGVIINPNSKVNFQVQIAAEIIDVPYIVVVYEYENTISKIVTKRDLGLSREYITFNELIPINKGVI